MKMLNDSLVKENHTKDREIRKLNKDVHQFEQTIMSLRNELSNNNYNTSEVPKKDVEVTADICCSGSQECGDVVPVRDSALCSARLRLMDDSVKASGDSVRSLRQLNVSLSEEVRALQSVCGALDEQCRAAGLRARFKDDIIHEMRRQLRQAKAKLKELSESNITKNQKEHDVGQKSASYDSLTIACVRRPRLRNVEPNCDCRNSVYDESDDDLAIVLSTPNTSSKFNKICINDSSLFIAEPPPSPPLELSDSSRDATCECRVTQTSDKTEVTMEGTSRQTDGQIKPECQTFGDNFQIATLAGLASLNKIEIDSKDSGSDVETRTRSLKDSLMAAAQALKNKDETVRLQAESLALAEERLAAASRTRNSATECHFDVRDVSTTTQLQNDREIVKTLQHNLSVIEELYRECFYETARQDEMIAVLRASCRGQPKQDVALEVENLKAEISNLLNNSTNNDSGVWEAGSEELRGVEEQLRRLWADLQSHCTCGLMEENMRLKKTNEAKEIQIQDLRQRLRDMEETLENKENSDQRYRRQIEEKELELLEKKKQLSDLEGESRLQRTAYDTLTSENKKLEGLLNDKNEELINIQLQCVSQEETIKKLREELETANTIANENALVRREVWSLSSQVAAWGRRLASEERRRHLAKHYAEKCTQAEELRAELQSAREGGAALCARARAALTAARDGLRALAAHARENEEIISQQELLIRSLRKVSSKHNSKRSSVSENDPCCSKYLHKVETRSDDRSFMGARETPRTRCTSSGTADGGPPPTPPRRLLRKKPLCLDRRCQWPQLREASVSCAPSESPMSSVVNREFSADSLLERVERTHEALELAHRRWCRHRHEHDFPAA